MQQPDNELDNAHDTGELHQTFGEKCKIKEWDWNANVVFSRFTRKCVS